METLDIELDDESLQGLFIIAKGMVRVNACDESFSIIDEAEVTTMSELEIIIGRALVNEMIVQALRESIEDKQELISNKT